MNLWFGAAGLIMERIGPRYLALLGSLKLGIGSITFAFGAELIDFSIDGFLIGYVLMGVGGASVLTSGLHNSNQYPSHRGLIMSLLIAGENFGSGMFLLFQYLYVALNISLKDLFLGYLFIPAAHALFACYFQPHTPLIAESNPDSCENIVESFPIVNTWNSRQWWLMALWGGCGLAYSYFYIGTLASQLAWLSDESINSDYVTHFTLVFSYMFIFFSLITVVVVGQVLDRAGLWAAALLSAAVTLLWGLASVLLPPELQLFTFMAFFFARQCCVGIWGHFANVMFGEKATQLLSISFALGGAFIFTNEGLVPFTTNTLRGDFAIVNFLLTGLNTSFSLVLAAAVFSWRLPSPELDSDSGRRASVSMSVSNVSSLRAPLLVAEHIANNLGDGDLPAPVGSLNEAVRPPFMENILDDELAVSPSPRSHRSRLGILGAMI